MVLSASNLVGNDVSCLMSSNGVVEGYFSLQKRQFPDKPPVLIILRLSRVRINYLPFTPQLCVAAAKSTHKRKLPAMIDFHSDLRMCK
jgi:hypothetical protein